MAHFITAPSITFSHEALASPVALSHEPQACTEAHVEADGTFARLWPTSLVLSQFLCENASMVRGKHVVELGAGSGAVGLVCAALGAASVTLTDVPEALKLIERNAAQNPQLASSVRVAPCTWGNSEHVAALLHHNNGCPFDVVLCCEVVYQQSTDVLAALAHTQRRLARPRDGVVLLGYEFRNALSEDIAYFDAATELFGESASHSLEPCARAAAAFMDEQRDDGGDDRWLYVYEVPETVHHWPYDDTSSGAERLHGEAGRVAGG